MRLFEGEIYDFDADRNVDRGCLPICTDEGVLVMRRVGGDQSVVQSASADVVVDGGAESSPGRSGGKGQPGGREAALEPRRHHRGDHDRHHAPCFGAPEQAAGPTDARSQLPTFTDRLHPYDRGRVD